MGRQNRRVSNLCAQREAVNSYAFLYECYSPPGRLSLLISLSVPDLSFAGSGVVGRQLDLPLCRCTITTIKMTRAMRTATKSLDVSIVLVSGVREDWVRVGAECDKLRCSYLPPWHKRHCRRRGGPVFYHERDHFEESGVWALWGHQNKEYLLFYSYSSSGPGKRYRPQCRRISKKGNISAPKIPACRSA